MFWDLACVVVFSYPIRWHFMGFPINLRLIFWSVFLGLDSRASAQNKKTSRNLLMDSPDTDD